VFDLDVEVEAALGAVEFAALRVRAYVVTLDLRRRPTHVLLTLAVLALLSAAWGCMVLRLRI